MLESLRRVVTGHDCEMKSTVWLDGPPVNFFELQGHGLAEIWSASATAPSLRRDEDASLGPLRLEPLPGGIKFRYFAVAPEKRNASDEEKAAAEAFVDSGFSMIGASHCRIDTSRHPAMHRTQTLDFIVVVSGEVSLLLDESEIHLKPGDTVVQRGTNHGWVNYGDEPALLVAVLLDAGTGPRPAA